jgi:hypothetical protein
MGDDVNGAWMSGIEDERATRYLFGTTILTLLLERESIHRKDARVAGHCGFPFRQYMSETDPHHAPLAEVKVERMCDHERENVARPVANDGAVTFDRESWVALEPSARCTCVTSRRTVHVGARSLDGSHAASEGGSRSGGVSAHDQRGTQTMAENGAGIVGQNSLNFGRGIPAVRKQ